MAHFENEFVVDQVRNQEIGKRGGKIVKNTCYGQTGSKEYGKSREEAISIKKQMNDGALLRFFKSTIARQPSFNSRGLFIFIVIYDLY